MKKLKKGGLGGSQLGIHGKRAVTGFLAAALLSLTTIAASNLAYAAPGGGGGGFHGGGIGGFHAGIGGFHAGVIGGFHAGSGGFHAGSGGFHAGGLAGFHAGGAFRAGKSRGFSGDETFNAGASAGLHDGRFSGVAIRPDAPLNAAMGGSEEGQFRRGSDAGATVLRGASRGDHQRQGVRYEPGYYPYLSPGDAFDDSYDTPAQTYAAPYSYYCSDPVGYYPTVSQCNGAWQTIPGGG